MTTDINTDKNGVSHKQSHRAMIGLLRGILPTSSTQKAYFALAGSTNSKNPAR